MRVLVATHRSQGHHPGDYCFTFEGELVTPLLPDCSAPGRCGCPRGFDGLESDRATTTAVIVDRVDLTQARVLALLDVARERACSMSDDARVPSAAEQLAEIERLTSGFPVGAIVRRDGRRYRTDADLTDAPSDAA